MIFQLISSLSLYILICLLLVPSGQAKQPLILVAADSAPTAYMDNGKVKGILVDIVTEAFKRAGYTVSIQLMPWARCLSK